ncbi:MAG: protoporphyrinogen oxidase HemJ [Alphaproteobacteria bacterium]|nr:protoporphyrinogen oxidase HemJ [Alphaproteobacteria bacterium]
MQEFVIQYYLIIKALHIIAVISWMAGLLYLPRLYVYHAGCTVGSEASQMLKTMENRLLRYIMNPAMIITFVFGGLLLTQPEIFSNGWLHIKLLLVVFLAGFHGMCSRWRKNFAADANQKSTKFFRVANEFPTIIMIVIVLLAVVKPF